MKNSVAVLLLFGLSVLPGLSAATELQCADCGKTLRGRYLKTSDGRAYCNKKCAEARFPRCADCGKRCTGSFIKADNRVFCSKECAEHALSPRCNVCQKPFRQGRQLPTPYGTLYYCEACAKLPTCFVCQTPGKDLKLLSDGRRLCRRCTADAVSDHAAAQGIFDSVRATLVRKLNFRSGHALPLSLTHYSNPHQSELGLIREFGRYIYRGREIYTKPGRLSLRKDRKTTVRREVLECRIEVLNHLPRIKMAEVMAHELAHDYMQRRWPYIKDDKTKEGFAEAVAAEYNRLTGHDAWNYRMEQNPDPVYGEGYRMVRAWQKQGGWPEVARRLEAVNQANLPAELRE